MSTPTQQELQQAYAWRKTLEDLGILNEVEDFIVRLCDDLDIDPDEQENK